MDDVSKHAQEVNENQAQPDFEDIPPPTDEDAEALPVPDSPVSQPVKEGKRGQKRAKQSKPDRTEVYRCLAKAINRDTLLSPWRVFPRRFHFIPDRIGGVDYVEVTAGEVVNHVGEDLICQAIIAYVEQQCPHLDGFYINMRQAREVVQMWTATRTALDPKTIGAVKQKSTPGLTYQRLPWDVSEGPTPLFDEIMGRTTNWRAVMAFIGSLFVDKSDRQKYLWLWGFGKNGKGTLARLLKKLLGGACSSEFPPDKRGDKFWTSGLVGKRLVQFNDCNNVSFVTSGLFKSLTGDDAIKVEYKGEKPFSTFLVAKYMFSSNEKPGISSEDADTRRIIFAEMAPLPPGTEDDPQYEDKLWKEAPHILWKCLMKYKELCPGNRPIPTDDDDTLANLISTNEEEFETAWTNNFELADRKLYVLPEAMQERLNALFKDRRRQSEFRKWMERCHNVRKITIGEESKKPKGYRGLRLLYSGDAIGSGELNQRIRQM